MRVFPHGAGLSIALIVVFIAAWCAPEFGLKGGPLFPDKLSFVAVFIIFLIQGWKLNLGRLKQALADRRTLFLLHSFIFLATLPMVWGISKFGLVDPIWIPGLFFLAILPTTISSCVVYSRAANGDADAALGHATASNFLGMLWVPLAWGFLILPGDSDGSQALDALLFVLPDFLITILLPCFVGWWARNKLSFALLPADGSAMDKIPIGCILLLAYFSFCSLFTEFENDLFEPSTGVLAIVVLLMLLVLTLLSWVVGRVVSGSRKARINFLFCGGQKSLALGLPLAQLLSGTDEFSAGLLVMPIAIFHFGQLLLGAFLIEPLRKWTK